MHILSHSVILHHEEHVANVNMLKTSEVFTRLVSVHARHVGKARKGTTTGTQMDLTKDSRLTHPRLASSQPSGEIYWKYASLKVSNRPYLH